MKKNFTLETDPLDMDAALGMTPEQWKGIRLSGADHMRFVEAFPALARDRDDAEMQLVKWLHTLAPIARANIVGNIRADLKRERKARAKTVRACERFLVALEADPEMKGELLESDALERVHNTLAKYEHVPQSASGRAPEAHVLLAQWAAAAWNQPTPSIIRTVRAVMTITDDQAESIRVKLAGRTKDETPDLNAAMRAWR